MRSKHIPDGRTVCSVLKALVKVLYSYALKPHIGVSSLSGFRGQILVFGGSRVGPSRSTRWFFRESRQMMVQVGTSNWRALLEEVG
jgi:hypothetical protein